MNGFFAVEDVPSDTDGWTTLVELAGDPTGRIRETATALRTDDRRAAASIDLLGVAARVLSPVLRRALERSAVPDIATIWWRHERPAPMRIAWRVEEFVPLTADTFVASVVQRHLGPVVDGYCGVAQLSPRVGWGNVASALNGAAIAMGDPPAVDFVRRVLEIGVVAGTALRLPPRFVRNSCCLLYRTGGGYCGDCVLRTRSAAFA